MQLRHTGGSFSTRATERAVEQLDDQLAFQVGKWPISPRSKTPCKLIKTNKILVDYSLFGGCLYYLVDPKKIDRLSISEFLKVFDLYTNLKQQTGETQLLSPDSAYWLCQAFANHTAHMKKCNKCKILYLKAYEQKVYFGCPFCK